MNQCEVVLDCGNELGEAPFWDEEQQRMVWVDIYGKKIFTLDVGTQEVAVDLS